MNAAPDLYNIDSGSGGGGVTTGVPGLNTNITGTGVFNETTPTLPNRNLGNNFNLGNPSTTTPTTIPGTDGTLSYTGNDNFNALIDPNVVSNNGTSTGTTTTNTGTGSNFTANTGGSTGVPGVGNLNVGDILGFNNGDPSALISQLDSLFGKGVGQVFYNFLSNGAGYSPTAATALANANLPYEERSRNNILESFGASGGRYGSPAAIGLGDFESSYALGQQAIFANEYDKAVDRYSRMFGGILDTAHLEQANKLGLKDILGLLSGQGGSIADIIKAIKGIKGAPGGTGGTGGTGGSTTGTKTGGTTTTGTGDGTKTTGTGTTTGLPGHDGWIKDSNGLSMSPDQWAANGFQDPNGSFNWDAFYAWAGEGGYSSGNGSSPVDTSGFINGDGSINWDNLYNGDWTNGDTGPMNIPTGTGGSGGNETGTGDTTGGDWGWLWGDGGSTGDYGGGDYGSGDTGGDGG